MDNKEILENAPEGATHVSDNGVYYKKEQSEPMSYVWWVRGEEWIDSNICHLTHSLDDIRAQLKLIERIGEFEKEIESYKRAFIEMERNEVMGRKLQPVRDLEQQTKVFELAITHFENLAKDTPLGYECKSKGSSQYNWMKFAANELRQKAQELKNG